MNKTRQSQKPYPVGSISATLPFPEKRHGEIVSGYDGDTISPLAPARKSKSSEAEPNYFLRKAVALGIAGLALIGVYEVGKSAVNQVQGPEVPALDTPYTIRPGDTAYGIATASMPNEEYRELQDELTDEANHLKRHPGFNAGNTINVPHQYLQYLQEQEQSQHKSE